MAYLSVFWPSISNFAIDPKLSMAKEELTGKL